MVKKADWDMPPQKETAPGPPALVFVGGSSCLSSLLIMGFLSMGSIPRPTEASQEPLR